MSKPYCLDCKKIVEQPHQWEEIHGEYKEPREGCTCGNALIEVDPCPICKEYPEDEYDEGKLPNGGICQSCFDQGIVDNFMEYLDHYGDVVKREFYLGIAFQDDAAYAFNVHELLCMCESKYKEYLAYEYCEYNENFGAHGTIKRFIYDTDPEHFAAWLIEKSKQE